MSRKQLYQSTLQIIFGELLKIRMIRVDLAVDQVVEMLDLLQLGVFL